MAFSISKTTGFVLACFVGIPTIVLVAIKLWSIQTWDPTDPRSLQNGYLMKHTVAIDRSPEQVYDFITHKMIDYNLSIAEAHDRFEILDGDVLEKGVTFIAGEYQEDEGVVNTYLVTDAERPRYLRFASTPTIIYNKKGDEWVETGKSNAFVYFDIADAPDGKSTVSQTVVIEMPNFLIKFLIDMIILGEETNEWQDHLVEELENLKIAIEGEPG